MLRSTCADINQQLPTKTNLYIAIASILFLCQDGATIGLQLPFLVIHQRHRDKSLVTAMCNFDKPVHQNAVSKCSKCTCTLDSTPWAQCSTSKQDHRTPTTHLKNSKQASTPTRQLPLTTYYSLCLAISLVGCCSAAASTASTSAYFRIPGSA